MCNDALIETFPEGPDLRSYVDFASVFMNLSIDMNRVVAICRRKTPWSQSGQLPITATAAEMLLRYCVSMTHCKRK